MTERDHIEQLIAELRRTRFPCADDLHVHWIDNRDAARAISDIDPVELYLPHIRSPEDYATALHELGHVCARYQKSSNVMTRERWAWDWARKKALDWTDAMESEAQASLQRYARSRQESVYGTPTRVFPIS